MKIISKFNISNKLFDKGLEKIEKSLEVIYKANLAVNIILLSLLGIIIAAILVCLFV